MKVKDTKRGKYVLAYLPPKNEWVTWGTDEGVAKFYWGRYFTNRDDAETDFLKRGEED